MRARLRDLGFSVGRFPVGPVQRDHRRRRRAGRAHDARSRATGRSTSARGPCAPASPRSSRTPNIFENRVLAGGFVLNGAGEVSGLTQVQEWGLLETPILLTNTMAVGKVSDAAVKWMTRKWPEIGGEDDVVIPLVGECDDSWLNDTVGRHVRSEHVYRAIEQATQRQGRRGIGGRRAPGLITCDFKAGIGTSSRRVTIEGARLHGRRAGAVELRRDALAARRRRARGRGARAARSAPPRREHERRLDHHHRRHRRAAAVVAAGPSLQARRAGHRPHRLVRGARLGRDHRRLLDRQPGAARTRPR